MDRPIQVRKPGLVMVHLNKTWQIMDFPVLADHRLDMKIKRYVSIFILPRELKTLWTIKVTVMPVIFGCWEQS